MFRSFRVIGSVCAFGIYYRHMYITRSRSASGNALSRLRSASYVFRLILPFQPSDSRSIASPCDRLLDCKLTRDVETARGIAMCRKAARPRNGRQDFRHRQGERSLRCRAIGTPESQLTRISLYILAMDYKTDAGLGLRESPRWMERCVHFFRH